MNGVVNESNRVVFLNEKIAANINNLLYWIYAFVTRGLSFWVQLNLYRGD